MLVDDLLRHASGRRPDAEVLACGASRVTFGELDATADRVAGGLAALGVGRGDRVALLLENGLDAVVAMCGALRAGAIFVPINPTTKAEKLAYLVGDCEPVAIVSDDRGARTIADARTGWARQPAVVVTGTSAPEVVGAVAFDALRSAAPPLRAPRRIDLDLAAIIYTSGSTGYPKGVMMSHANVVAATTSINRYLQNTSDDVILDVLPLSFDYGLYQLFLAFQSGARVVLARSFAYPALLLELMARERVTGLPIVPMIATLLLRQDLTGRDLSSLRYLTNTGAVLPPSHIAALRDRLPRVRIFSMYGLTECKRVSYLPPDEIDHRPTSVGKPMDNVEVYLLDENGQRVDTGVGELVVRGANVMQGYWRAPEDSARVLQPGPLPGETVLRTGDIFRIDDDGYMYFQSRTDDVIKSRGQKVSPREVENVLHGAPGVQEAVVVGVPDPVLGEAVKAFVTLDGTVRVAEQDLLYYCAKHLEDFMVPRAIEIRDELPHTGTGKVARRPLRTPALS